MIAPDDQFQKEVMGASKDRHAEQCGHMFTS